MGAMIEFARPDGGKTKGYLATAGQGRPGIVVIQEWWGLNDQICGVADRFARAGYNALAPDLYKGRADRRARRGQPSDDRPRFPRRDAPGFARRGAASARGSSGKVGVMGFCMGGALTVAAAVHVPEVAAGVCFYGIPPARNSPTRRRSRSRSRAISPTRTIGARPAAVDELETAMKGPAPPGDLPLRRRARLLQRAQRRLRPRLRQPGLGPHGGVLEGEIIAAHHPAAKNSRRSR